MDHICISVRQCCTTSLDCWSKDRHHQHHLGVCQKCRIFAPPAGLLNQKLILRIAPGNSYTKFERHCHSNTFRIFSVSFFFISCLFFIVEASKFLYSWFPLCLFICPIESFLHSFLFSTNSLSLFYTFTSQHTQQSLPF